MGGFVRGKDSVNYFQQISCQSVAFLSLLSPMLFYQVFTGLVTVITSSINPYAVSEFFINVLSDDMLFFLRE